MNELNILLTQIEKTDIGLINTILDSGFNQLLSEFITNNIDEYFDKFNTSTDFSFAVRAQKLDDHRTFLVGLCGIWDIDWIARHGKLFFFMVDRDGHKSTMQNHPATRDALSQILEFAFDELNLNKVWIEVLENNDIKETLEYFGFVAEGIRRDSTFKYGKFLNSIICSLVYEEYCDKVSR